MVFHLLAVLPLLATALAQGNSTQSVRACSALASSFPNQLLYPNSTAYTSEVLHIWDKRCNFYPTCVFAPKTAADVSKGLATLSSNNAQFAVRGGGHMNVPGSNGVKDGVLVSLTGLKDIKIGGDNNTVEVGPGNQWFDVYTFLEPYGKIVIGGRLKTIGVPGLTLIGGVHYFLNKYGFAMDNVKSYEVVLGNGTIVTAAANSNPDLFWALKGGANNFGVVTKFSLKTYDHPQVSTTIQLFNNESIVQPWIKAVCDFTRASDPSIAAGAVFTISYNATTKAVSATVLGVQEGTVSPPTRFANFTAIPGVAKINAVSTIATWARRLDAPLQMFRIQFGHHTIKPDATQLYSLYQTWKAAVEQVADVPGLNPTFVLNTAPKSGAAVGKKNGIGNTWGLDDREDYIWWQISTGWGRAEDDVRMQNWGRQLVARLHMANQAKGLSTEFVYMGDAADYQNPFIGWARGNVAKARSIKAKYDPSGVFTRLNRGGFKL